MWDSSVLIDMYESRGPLGHDPKWYGGHREPRLPVWIRHGSPTPYASSVSTQFSGVCPDILGKYISDPWVCSIKSGLGRQHNTTQHNTTKQNKTKQNKTKQNKTKQNKTKQNSTLLMSLGSEYEGI